MLASIYIKLYKTKERLLPFSRFPMPTAPEHIIEGILIFQNFLSVLGGGQLEVPNFCFEIQSVSLSFVDSIVKSHY